MKRKTLDIIRLLVWKLHEEGIERIPSEIVGYAKGLARDQRTASVGKILHEIVSCDDCYKVMREELIRLG